MDSDQKIKRKSKFSEMSSKQNYERNGLANKRFFTRYVAKKIPHIKYEHVAAVFTLFLEEFVLDLFKNKSFKISNFGEFNIKERKGHRIFNIITEKYQMRKDSKRLEFKLVKKIRPIILKFLDVSSIKNK